METPSLEELLAMVVREEPADEGKIRAAEAQLSVTLPSDYRDLLLVSNGLAGPIGDQGYIALWAVEELVERNEANETPELLPGVVLIGGDGADEGYGIDFAGDEASYVIVPLLTLDRADVVAVSSSLRGFCEALGSGAW